MTSGVESLSTFIEHLKQLHTILMKNHYIHDTTKRLKQLIDDAQNPPMIAFIGKEQVGKTTLMNALLGRAIFPTGQIANTAANIFIRYGQEERVKAYFTNGRIVCIRPTSVIININQSSSQLLRQHLHYVELYLPHDFYNMLY